MALVPGARLGPYDIVAALGAGGMGEVYRARDTTLNRDVAIKVLPDLFASDAERLARFTREAQALASLNHPNIAIIYGLENFGGVRALVMEVVEGEDVSQRIARGAIPIDEALPIATQIADALEAAHEHGIIHRDLKPANIKLRSDGTVKVLDFGLAKAMEPTVTGNVSMSPTLTLAATQAGVILGTAAYMSPEQAKAKSLDKRTDIWSFGCVLFEMLTGRRAFGGEDVSDTIASILRGEPDWAALPVATPPPIRRLLRRCLEKDSRRRLHDIADARIEMSATPTEWDDEPRQVSSPPGRSRERLAWMTAGVLGLAALAGGIMTVLHVRESATVAPPVAFTVNPPDGTTFITPQSTGLPWLAVSPDGRTLAFVALAADGRQQLWLRPLAATAAYALPATDDARAPFWSPDSRYIAFFAQGKLKYVEATGGTPQVLSDASRGAGGSWGRDNIILFSGAPSEGLQRLSFGGNRVGVPVTRVDTSKGERAHAWPEFLPDGRHFLFAVALSRQTDTWIGSVDGEAPRFLFTSTANARYAPPGYLLYSAGGALMARRFDADTLSFAGDAFQVADAVVGANQATAYTALSTSATGVVVSGAPRLNDPRLVWIDRQGNRSGPIALPHAYDPALSPNGTMLAVTRNHPQTGIGIWLFDLKREIAKRLNLDAAATSLPVWSPDGKYVAFRSTKGDRLDVLYRKLADGSGSEELLLDMEGSQPTDWSSDGRFILFHLASGGNGSWHALWALPLADRKAKPLTTSFIASQAVLSRDMQWLAYASDETGVREVYVDSFPPTGRKTPVSRGGGAEPQWRFDGRELFYVSADRRLMVVPTKMTPTFEAGRPESLFEMNIWDLTSPFARRRYQPTPDGQRFLVVEQSTTRVPPLTVLVNWPATLQKR